MRPSLSSIFHTYTQRFRVKDPYFMHPPDPSLCLSIVIPSYKEPDILTTLRSLAACQPPPGAVEIIVVVNAPENAGLKVLEYNQHTLMQLADWDKEKPAHCSLLLIREENLPLKFAGAGLARKIGMDEAARRWAMLGKDGPILCLDADCTVSDHYLQAAHSAFSDPAAGLGHFQFEHLYAQESDPVLRAGILQYELHLRCYIQGLKMAGYPFARHTVGSCMAVRASVYAQGGGMNRRKAGEDFYFLHKLLPLVGWKEIPATVYPACRASDRVPFGTGKAQTDWQRNPGTFYSYHPEIYKRLKLLFEAVPEWYGNEVSLEPFAPGLRDFLEEAGLIPKVLQMRKQSNSPAVFRRRYWQWMDGFMVLKLTHHLRDRGLPSLPVIEVAQTLSGKPVEDPEQLLEYFRELDRSL